MKLHEITVRKKEWEKKLYWSFKRSNLEKFTGRSPISLYCKRRNNARRQSLGGKILKYPIEPKAFEMPLMIKVNCLSQMKKNLFADVIVMAWADPSLIN